MSIDLQTVLRDYLTACRKTTAIYADANLSTKGKQEKANAVLEEGAQSLQDYYDKHLTPKVDAARNEAEKRRVDLTKLADEDSIRRAWDRMRPFQDQDWPLNRMAMYATDAADLAALATYGRPYLAAQLTAANNGEPVQPQRVNQEMSSINKTLEDTMKSLGIAKEQREQYAQAQKDLFKLENEQKYVKALITKKVHPGRLDTSDRVALGYANAEVSNWMNAEVSEEFTAGRQM